MTTTMTLPPPTHTHAAVVCWSRGRRLTLKARAGDGARARHHLTAVLGCALSTRPPRALRLRVAFPALAGTPCTAKRPRGSIIGVSAINATWFSLVRIQDSGVEVSASMIQKSKLLF